MFVNPRILRAELVEFFRSFLCRTSVLQRPLAHPGTCADLTRHHPGMYSDWIAGERSHLWQKNRYKPSWNSSERIFGNKTGRSLRRNLSNMASNCLQQMGKPERQSPVLLLGMHLFRVLRVPSRHNCKRGGISKKRYHLYFSEKRLSHLRCSLHTLEAMKLGRETTLVRW